MVRPRRGGGVVTAQQAEWETALWWARIRATGPQLAAMDSAVPPGLTRLAEPGGSQGWLIPVFPGGAGPAVLDELDLPRPVLEMPNDTARVLAVCVRCCWADPTGPLWPGVSVPFGRVAAAFESMTGRDRIVSHRAVVAAVRRLSWSGWLLWDAPGRLIRLGPRVATWSPAELTALRELWRSIPAPENPVPEDPGPDGDDGEEAGE